MPPENSCGYERSRSAARGMPTLHQLDRLSHRVALADLRVVGPDLLDDLPPDPVHGVQRAHRILEDHRDLAAANPAEVRGRRGHQLAAIELGAALDPGIGAAGQAHQRQPGDGLPRAGFADDRNDLAAVDGERDSVDRADQTVLRRERDMQFVDRQQSFAAGGALRRPGAHESRIRGSRNAYNRSTTAPRITTANAVNITIDRSVTTSKFPTAVKAR
jgi:hypothetical protein